MVTLHKQRQWGEPPWRFGKLAPFRSAHELSDGSTPDVAIIGCGFTGASTALHLANLGIDNVVLEAERVASGASGRTGGLVLEGTAAGLLDHVSECVPGLKRIVEAEVIDCDLDLPGCWEIQHKGSSRQRALPWSDTNGSGIWITDTVPGGVVQPARLTIGLARAAERKGAAIYEHAQVTRIETKPQLTLELADKRIRPKHLVVATNAWINDTLPETPQLGSSLTFACATERVDSSIIREIGLGDGIPFYTEDLPYLWGRTVRDGRIIFGAGLIFGSGPALEQLDTNEGDFAKTLEAMKRRIRGLHPLLADVKFSAAWGGPIAFARDAKPLLGRLPSCPEVIVSGAYAGHGVALSVRAGELIANAIAFSGPLPEWGALDRFWPD